jgi:hypothetical protein
MSMSWLWGEKKPTPKKLPYEVTNKEQVYMHNKVKLHLILDVKSPISQDVVTLLKNSRVNFLLPHDATIADVRLSHIDLISRGGVK